jgi:multicomponent Na+:H+ antiporter subunit E
MRWLLQTVPLVLFWLVLSGHYTLLLLSLGAVSTALVVALTRRAGVADVRVTARRLVRLPWYFAWLGGQVLVSAAAVARLAWSPRSALRPVVETVPLPSMSALSQAAYANSITFTPGTLALDVDDDHIRVHALQPGSVEVLRGGEMARRVLRFLEAPR